MEDNRRVHCSRRDAIDESEEQAPHTANESARYRERSLVGVLRIADADLHMRDVAPHR